MGESSRRVRVLGTDVDALSLSQAVEIVVQWLSEIKGANGDTPPCRYVVTPNLDHAVQLQDNAALRSSYDDASMVVADGMPLIWAARLMGQQSIERVAGSDLAPAVLQAAPTGTAVFLLGASDDSSRKAAERIGAEYPNVRIVGRLSPPKGFESSEEWSGRIVEAVRESGAELLLVGLGAPKQEIWVHRHRNRLQKIVVLCVGATIDFFSGEQKRAPLWIQQAGFEWLHRALTNPKRLAARYAKDAVRLPGLLARDMRDRRRGSG